MQYKKANAFWMPFTANRQFLDNPRLLVSANGMYYRSEDDRRILDGTAGLWCVNAGHARDKITQAVSKQIAKLDFAPTFQMGHPLAFELADALVKLSPEPLNHVFFTNSGSESVETALKIALAYQTVRGKPNKKRLIGREKGYHGTNFGGVSVGGLVNNKRDFSQTLPFVDHLIHAHDSNSIFSIGQPELGAHFADDLLRIIALQGAENIAAVIVEPVVGSGGVWIPPLGYLKRLREITQAHDILLIFDEVITGFGRVGDAFASTRFEVTPDILTTAKGLTNGALPMGAVFVNDTIYDAFMQGPSDLIEFFHGYTYSGHPVAAAAALATLSIYEDEQLFKNAYLLEGYFAKKLHQLREYAMVKDIRNLGLMAAVELHPSEKPGERGMQVLNECFFNQNALVRVTGDTIALSPPLIVETHHIDQLVLALNDAIKSIQCD